MRDHGGNLDEAMTRHGAGDWIDLSTGINRRSWPLPAIPPDAWTALPTRSAMARLIDAARSAWQIAPETAGTALAGAQAAIQLVPGLRAPGQARVLGPTYNEHAAALQAQGWRVAEVTDPGALEGADLAVLVNPNNPDGRSLAPDALQALAARVGFLVVDESFADVTPALSLLPQTLPRNILVMRSFGKFYGLAGLRLGFAFADPPIIAMLAERVGPWPVSGPAIHVGTAALSDTGWARAMRHQLALDAARADRLALGAGWTVEGGTTLFRLYHTHDAKKAQDDLARRQIWSRIFPWSPHLLRLGLPGHETEWDRLATVLQPR